MCGIAGILSVPDSQVGLEKHIRQMQSYLQHRGPDDTGIYLSGDRAVALAHTRLAILDLSAAGHQPMATPDGRYWITFNGEIYNFRSLRVELESRGEHFTTQTDTEVILKLYQHQGQDCLKRLRGMFAFVIWDDQQKTAFLARDPLGIKPLYYWSHGSTLLFASELRAILATGLPALELSPAGLYGYLTSGSVPEPHTLIEGIHCLEAGHFLTWHAGNLSQRCYWQISFAGESSFPWQDATQTREAARTLVREALVDSVQHHLVSDVPVGVFLSGGIDSTGIVALASQMQTAPLQTYSIAFEEAAWNEGDAARKIAQHFGTDHTEVVVTASLGQTLLKDFLAGIDQPSVDGFNTFSVSKVAHENGAKVVLSGLGGDELFGGYPSFQKIRQILEFRQWLNPLAPLSSLVGQSIETWSGSAQLRRLGDFLQRTPTATAAYTSFRGVFSHLEACVLIRHYLGECPLPTRQSDPLVSGFATLEDTVSFLELSRYMRNQLLRDSDVMSMRWGLELRVPLVDQRLVEAIAPIPSPLRLMRGKQLLTQAIPEIPDWVINQPKKGFLFPYQKWMQTEWKDQFKDLDRPQGIPLHPWYRRWSLFILQQWWNQIRQ